MSYLTRKIDPDWHLDGECNAYRALSDFENEAEALRLLRRCTYKVGPIMRSRGWKIPSLVEITGDGWLLGYKRLLPDAEGVCQPIQSP